MCSPDWLTTKYTRIAYQSVCFEMLRWHKMNGYQLIAHASSFIQMRSTLSWFKWDRHSIQCYVTDFIINSLGGRVFLLSLFSCICCHARTFEPLVLSIMYKSIWICELEICVAINLSKSLHTLALFYWCLFCVRIFVSSQLHCCAHTNFKQWDTNTNAQNITGNFHTDYEVWFTKPQKFSI